jgi:hypothetical protein
VADAMWPCPQFRVINLVANVKNLGEKRMAKSLESAIPCRPPTSSSVWNRQFYISYVFKFRFYFGLPMFQLNSIKVRVVLVAIDWSIPSWIFYTEIILMCRPLLCSFVAQFNYEFLGLEGNQHEPQQHGPTSCIFAKKNFLLFLFGWLAKKNKNVHVDGVVDGLGTFSHNVEHNCRQRRRNTTPYHRVTFDLSGGWPSSWV